MNGAHLFLNFGLHFAKSTGFFLDLFQPLLHVLQVLYINPKKKNQIKKKKKIVERESVCGSSEVKEEEEEGVGGPWS